MRISHYSPHILLALISAIFVACSTPTTSVSTDEEESSSSFRSSSISNAENSATQTSSPSHIVVNESGRYTTRDSVAAYICEFDKLPSNYIGKDEGQILYESLTGNAFSKWNFNPWETLGVMIGGDSYSDSDGILLDGTYHEADVDYGNVQSRGTKRLIYQSGCIIYYTADHYTSFGKIEF